ncbi:hypothetical protein, partial [Rubrivivax rivuli]|uniref:hypothetical protein n=1 Tax=Rubrivivax rivuli TaxID=1862385 RepID=UPI00196AC875
ALMVGVPLGIALLLLSFGQIQLGSDEASQVNDKLRPLQLACLISVIIVAGMARRDHSDRSVEFWLSLPATHSASLAAPLVVHLLLVPAAALLAGLAGEAVLWLSPLILLVVLLSAWFRSWSWVILGVGIGLGSQLLNR